MASLTDKANTDAAARRAAGKRAVDRLLKTRRQFTGLESEFIPQINQAIACIRELSQKTNTQREELVLWSIEKSMATSINEICEDCHLAPEIVKAIVKTLTEQNILYFAKRLIPGSGRQYYLIKSNRVKTPEVVGDLCK